jgi:hypothetical protein
MKETMKISTKLWFWGFLTSDIDWFISKLFTPKYEFLGSRKEMRWETNLLHQT